MAFVRPTLAALIERIETDLIGRLQINAQILRRAMLRVMARAWAGATHGLHGHVEWAARQVFASSADREYLDLHGAELSIARKAATFAVGNVKFVGSVDGTNIPSGTRVQRVDGVVYETTALGSIAAGIATIAAKASVAGLAGNTDANVSVSLVSPIANVNSAASIATGGMTNGADTEGDEAYRGRILARKRNPPQSGLVADFERWTLEVAGVIRAWVYPNHRGAGTVWITFVLDGNAIPDSGKVAEVQSYLDAPARRPVCPEVTVFAPVASPINPQIQLFPDTPAVRSAVVAQLTDLLYREGAPGAVLLVDHIREAISTAAGEQSSVLVSPAAHIVLEPGQLPTVGTITWL